MNGSHRQNRCIDFSTDWMSWDSFTDPSCGSLLQTSEQIYINFGEKLQLTHSPHASRFSNCFEAFLSTRIMITTVNPIWISYLRSIIPDLILSYPKIILFCFPITKPANIIADRLTQLSYALSYFSSYFLLSQAPSVSRFSKDLGWSIHMADLHLSREDSKIFFHSWLCILMLNQLEYQHLSCQSLEPSTILLKQLYLLVYTQKWVRLVCQLDGTEGRRKH